MMNDLKKKVGRPRIEDEDKPVFTNTAYSIVKMGDKWMLVKIQFNPLSGHSGPPELTIIGPNSLDAQERLKITLAKELF